MSELIAWEYCKKCKKETQHIFSGSGRKGMCMTCSHELPEEQRADLSMVVSYNG